MFIGVNGTGVRNDGQYWREMNGSFLHQLFSETPETQKLHWRGPTLLGLEVSTIADNLVREVVSRLVRNSNQKVFLAGYSRGGAVCIVAARRLQVFSINVHCMALFDAVDRDIMTDSTVIPGNVLNVYHAIRDQKAGSRTSFGNCGLSIETPGILTKATFFATHAGMGGVPWTGDHPEDISWRMPTFSNPRAIVRTSMITETQDRGGSAQVREWMWRNLRPHSMV